MHSCLPCHQTTQAIFSRQHLPPVPPNSCCLHRQQKEAGEVTSPIAISQRTASLTRRSQDAFRLSPSATLPRSFGRDWAPMSPQAARSLQRAETMLPAAPRSASQVPDTPPGLSLQRMYSMPMTRGKHAQGWRKVGCCCLSPQLAHSTCLLLLTFSAHNQGSLKGARLLRCTCLQPRALKQGLLTQGLCDRQHRHLHVAVASVTAQHVRYSPHCAVGQLPYELSRDFEGFSLTCALFAVLCCVSCR